MKEHNVIRKFLMALGVTAALALSGSAIQSTNLSPAPAAPIHTAAYTWASNGNGEDITEDSTWGPCPYCGMTNTCVSGDEMMALGIHMAACPKAPAD